MSETNPISQIIADEVKQHLAAQGLEPKESPHHFRKAVFRGLGVLLPPLLTVVILFWIGGTVADYVIKPFYYGTRSLIVYSIADIVLEKKLTATDKDDIGRHEKKKRDYRRLPDATYVPLEVWNTVSNNSSAKSPIPKTGLEVYRRYVELKYMNPAVFLPVSIVVFILILYLVGKFIAAEVGRFIRIRFEKIVNRVPLVSNVYGAVKQISDLIFAETEIKYSRIVAIEWPRKGLWVLAFVTGEGFPSMERLIGEPVYAVLVPTSPMPLTGFTLTVRRSEAYDVNITIDQAVQFVVSCGVVAVSEELTPPR